MSRRRLIAAGVVGAAAVVAAVVVDPFGGPAAQSSNGGVDNGSATSLATVKRQPISSQTLVSATLGYADTATIVASGGTSTSAIQQAQQSLTTAQGQLGTAQATLAADRTALVQAQATRSADRARQAVDCRGDNAAESGSAGGSTGVGACAGDMQTATTDEQAVTTNLAKVASDERAVASAQAGVASAEAAVATAQSGATSYGQTATFTKLPVVGAIVARGGTLYEISGAPVVLLYGPVTAWRPFVAGMSPGRDVAQLNANLRALGYGAGTGDAFTGATAAAISALQAHLGLAQTGSLLLGSVVFQPGAVRVTSVTPSVGAAVQPGPVLAVTSTKRQVTIALDAAQQASIKVGDPVVITLPDNRTTPGKVSYVGTVATAPSGDNGGGGGGGSPTIEVDVTPTDPAATGRLDQAPVSVAITTASVRSALVVPVNALLALAGGGYAVEVAEAGGVRRLAGVAVGLFDDADGLVQVEGNALAPGQRVVVPAQ